MSWEGGNGDGDMETRRLRTWPFGCFGGALQDAGMWYQDGRFGVFGASRCHRRQRGPARGAAFHPAPAHVASSCCLRERGQAGPLPGHRKCPVTPQSLRGSGTNCPPRCDLGTTKCREVYKNRGGIFHAMEQVGLGPLGISIASSFLHPFFYSCPRPVAQGAACLCPPQRAKTRSGTLTRGFVIKNNPVGPSPAALNWGQIFPAAGVP